MHHIPQLLFIAVSLFVIYGAIRYSGPAQMQVLGIFAADGTRLDRPAPALVSVRAVSRQDNRALFIQASGDAHVTIGRSGISVRGPGRITISG